MVEVSMMRGGVDLCLEVRTGMMPWEQCECLLTEIIDGTSEAPEVHLEELDEDIYILTADTEIVFATEAGRRMAFEGAAALLISVDCHRRFRVEAVSEAKLDEIRFGDFDHVEAMTLAV